MSEVSPGPNPPTDPPPPGPEGSRPAGGGVDADGAPSSPFYRWIVEHPVAVWMITIAACVFGMVSYAQLPLNLMPDISYPTLTVRTEYAGAAPEEVESQVSRPLEEALSTVEGLVDIESRSRAGISDVTLEFDWGTPMNGASQDVRERLQTTFLPDGAGRPLILRYDPSLDPILRVAVSGGTDLLTLREYAERDLKRQLETIDGVAAVTVRGGLERQVLVEPREDWLAARGVTLAQLSSLLTAENVNVAGGIVREGENEYLIRTLNEFTSLDEVRELAVVRPDGVRVRVGEVATVSEGSADPEVVARLDGAPAVELEVRKEADANIVTVARAVKAALGAEVLEKGLATKVLDDQASFIEASIQNLFENGVEGGILAILVTFVFLRNWVTTGIISTAIPISLVCTFAVMYLGDISLNLMSLGGLALGVSMVIDSGTVVLESIQNHLDAGKARMQAAVDGTAEVATAVFASVLTGMAVFFPIVFVEGIAGQIFGDLALTVVFSLLASLVVALVFIPMLAARELTIDPPPARALDIPSAGPRAAVAALRARGPDGAKRPWWAWPWALLRFVVHLLLTMAGVGFAVLSGWAARLGFATLAGGFGLFNRVSLWFADRFLAVYARVEALFARWLGWALDRPGLVLFFGGASFVVGLLLFGQVGAELVPEVHQGRFTIEAALPVGTPLTKTVATIDQVEREIRGTPGIASLYTVVGTERRADSKPDEGENTARLLVEMTPGGDLEAREAALMDALRAKLAVFPRLETRFRRPALFSFRTPVEVVLHGNDLDVLKEASATGLAALGKIPTLTDLRSSLARGYPEVRVRYDRVRLDALGLGVGEVAQAVRAKVQGVDATRLSRGERRVDVLVRLAEQDRDSIEALGAINVNPRLVPAIRLDAVADVEEGEGPSEIRRIDQQRAVVLSANLEGFDLSGAGAAVEAALRGVTLPAGVEFEIGGQNRELARSMGSLELALGLAVFLVYVIMASTFESIRDPFVILFSVPLALVGVSGGLWMTGTPVSVVVFIGLIVLAGVVVANAIVLVDAINRLREEGRPLQAAIQEAAALRLRPILITALNSVLGLLPLALGIGQGAEIQKPLAITVIFGLASSTFLTLVVVPVVYRLVTGRRGGEPRVEAGAGAGAGPGAGPAGDVASA
jgi:HAE1 family hydrophobic/amphiphilic exporter-1